jgi:hypothetical protein
MKKKNASLLGHDGLILAQALPPPLEVSDASIQIGGDVLLIKERRSSKISHYRHHHQRIAQTTQTHPTKKMNKGV